MATTKKTSKAKKSSAARSRSAKKMTPAVRYLRYELTNSGTPGTETSHYIDLARDLSRVNRRLYRQGRDYHVKRVTIVSSNTNQNQGADPAAATNAGRVSFSTAPDSWVSRSAWQRGFQMWNKMNGQATALTNNMAGTYHDFKVFLTDAHRAGIGSQLIPKDNGGNDAQSGEWIYSRIVAPTAGATGNDEYQMHMLGAHNGSPGAYTSIGLIQSYGDARASVSFDDSPDVPSAASDDPLMNLFDDGDTMNDIIGNVEILNDTPPYDDLYPGAANMPKPLVVQDTTLGVDGKSTVGGFSALCGLIEIESTSPLANDVYSVLVELAPGNYRGLKAEVI